MQITFNTRETFYRPPPFFAEVNEKGRKPLYSAREIGKRSLTYFLMDSYYLTNIFLFDSINYDS